MAGKHNYVLGINAYDHDVSACLLRNGEIAVAIEKERLTREKHDTGYYGAPVDYCLKAEGIALADVDMVVRNSYILPVEEMETRLMSHYQPHYLDFVEREEAEKSPLFLSNSDKVVTISHHIAHAYSAFAACPFEDGVVMVVDGVGSYAGDVPDHDKPDPNVNPLARESESYYRFSGKELETLKKVWLQPVRGFLSDEFFSMAGLGALYSRVSMYIFADWNKCGEVMGLAPYGRPDRIPKLMHMEDGELVVPDWGTQFDKPFMDDSDEAWEDSQDMQHWKDMAWRVQDDTEEVLLARARWLRETTGAKNLCIAGGVALNCVANGRIIREAGFDNVWIQPAAGDDGIAIGCALYGQLALQDNERSFVMTNACLGRSYSKIEIETAANSRLVRAQTRRHVSDDICAETAALLAQEHVLGWFQNGAEFGPRALGNRSIIADPRRPEMKDKLNKRVKHRQAFRPFAPIVIAERADEIFEGKMESPYMLVAMNVKHEWRNKIPAITHVDGTARVQTVTREMNERLYDLLVAFDKLTGVPVLLNTSFNVRGEPIIETPEDAIRCFLTTGIDYLALDDVLVSKNAMHTVLSPFAKAYRSAREATQAADG